MISYIDEYNDNVEKQCMIKNKKHKEKQRNGLLNPNLKFSSSLNAFIPPPNSDSPKINKSDFMNIVKSKYESLGKEPPSDVEIEDAFVQLNNTGEDILAVLAEVNFALDSLEQSPNEDFLAEVNSALDSLEQSPSRTNPFGSPPPLRTNIDVLPFESSGESFPFGSPPILPTPPTAPPIRNINLTTDRYSGKSPPPKILTRKEAQKSGLLLSDKNLTMSQQFEEAAKRGVRTAKQEAVKALKKMGFANQKEYWKSRIEAHSNPLVSGRISKQPEGNTSAQSPEPEGLYDSGDMTLPFY
tara:strand:+ start:3170 stop:4063 length:894 start_codon:yes stop_codon:yes gene_type:complete